VKATALRNLAVTYFLACYLFEPDAAMIAFIYSPVYIAGDYLLQIKICPESCWMGYSITLASIVCALHHCNKRTEI
jgi:hypothetical protein